MAAGFWNKLKEFGKKVWSGIKTAGQTVLGLAAPISNALAAANIPGVSQVAQGVSSVVNPLQKLIS